MGRQMAASGRTGSGLTDTDDLLSSQIGPGEGVVVFLCQRWSDGKVGWAALTSAHEDGGLS